MKIALCFSGQYRTFDSVPVQNTLHYYLLNKYECDTYFSIWDDRGISLNHGTPLLYKDEKEIITKSHITNYIKSNVIEIEIENYKKWYENSTDEIKSIMSCSFLPNSIPQLYKRHKVYELIPKNKTYDLVILTRPDLIYLEDLDIGEYIKYPNVVWNINPEGTFCYYPNRIFDILTMGRQSDMGKMSKCFFSIKCLLNDPLNSGLSPLDPCKMLNIYAKLHCGFDVKSTKKVMANIYRSSNCISYICKETKRSEEEFRKKHSL